MRRIMIIPGKSVIFHGPMWASAPTALNRMDIVRIPYVKYSMGANETTCTVCRALGKPDSAARPKGVLTTETKRQHAEQNDTPFQARKRYKNVPEPFSSISFPARGKRYGPRSGGCGFANRTAPPAHSKHAAGGIPRHSGAHEITPLPVRKMAHRRPCRIQTPSK